MAKAPKDGDLVRRYEKKIHHLLTERQNSFEGRLRGVLAKLLGRPSLGFQSSEDYFSKLNITLGEHRSEPTSRLRKDLVRFLKARDDGRWEDVYAGEPSSGLHEEERELVEHFRQMSILDRLDIYDESAPHSLALMHAAIERPRVFNEVLHLVIDSFVKSSARAGRHEDCAAIIDRFLALSHSTLPSNLRDQLLLGKVQLFLGSDLNRAMASLESAGLSFAHRPRLLTLLSHLQRKCDRLAEAEATMERIDDDVDAGHKSDDILLLRHNLDVARHPGSVRYINDYFSQSGSAGFSLDAARGETFLGQLTPQCEPDTRDGPLVTVIMPYFKSAKTISYALRSLLEQSYRNIEIICIDDLGNDGSSGIVDSIAAGYTGPKSIYNVRSSGNFGPYVARNVGMKLARGAYIAFLDADDYAHPERIQRQVAHLEDSGTRFNYCRCIRLGTKGEVQLQRWTVSLFSHFAGACLMMKADVVADLGFYDCVRFDGDFEYSRRKDLVFPDRHSSWCDDVLYIAEFSDTSLTTTGAGSLDVERAAPSRLAYKKILRNHYAGLKNPDLRVDCVNRFTIGDYTGLDMGIELNALVDHFATMTRIDLAARPVSL